jgi:hypothetical protein
MHESKNLGISLPAQDEGKSLLERLRSHILSRIPMLPKRTALYLSEICSTVFWTRLDSRQRRIAGTYVVLMVAKGEIALTSERFGNTTRMYSIH